MQGNSGLLQNPSTHINYQKVNLGTSHSFSVQEKKDIAQTIDLYLKHAFKDKAKKTRALISPAHSQPSEYFIVEARRSNIYDLYIRFNMSHEKSKTIVIARMYFTKTRKGSGSSLLYELIKIARTHGYTYFHLECVNENSRAFGERLGFKPYGIAGISNNLYTSTDSLEACLAKYIKS